MRTSVHKMYAFCARVVKNMFSIYLLIACTCLQRALSAQIATRLCEDDVWYADVDIGWKITVGPGVLNCGTP